MMHVNKHASCIVDIQVVIGIELKNKTLHLLRGDDMVCDYMMILIDIIVLDTRK